MGTGSGYRGDTYISRRVNLSTAMEFCGYDSNLCSCGDGGLDVTGERLTAEKVPYFWAFRASDHQRRGTKMAAKIAPWKHIKGNVRRVE